MHLRLTAVVLAVALVAPAALSQSVPVDSDDRVRTADGERSSASGSSGAAQQDGGSGEAAETTTFYPHVFSHGIFDPMPFNTEFPAGEDNYGVGYFGYCEPTGASAVPPTLGLGNGQCEDSPSKRLATFSTPGIVQVENRDQWENQGAYAQLHNERGQMKDVFLDDGKPVSATIFMTWDRHGWPIGADPSGTNCIHPHPPDIPCVYPYWGWDPGVNPNAVVEAELYLADLGERGANASEAPPVEEAIEEGDAEVIAEGVWKGTMMNGLPGGQAANEITIDLGNPHVAEVPKDDDVVLLYKWYSEEGGEKYGTSSWRIYAGEFFPPSFQLPVENPIAVERVVPTFAHGRLAILGIASSPWGSYDVDETSVEMSVEGPDGQTVNPDKILKSTSFSLAHGGHFKPVNKTWVWDYNAEGVQPGEYQITVTAANIQDTGQGSCTATVTLERGQGDKLIPGESEPGVCGQQAIEEERLEELEEGAQEEAGGD